MSNQYDYNVISTVYDNQMTVMGTDVMVAKMQFHCGKRLKDIHVLDAGCGTGNYALEFIQHGVGHVTLLDASPGMLEKAKSKLSEHIASGKVTDVIEAMIPMLPFPDGSFDAIMYNLVLQHLEASENRDFTTKIDALKEARRVLKPNGLIMISTILPTILRQSVWYMQIQPKITDRCIKHMPYLNEWEQIFESSNLQCVQKLQLFGAGLQKDYYNFEGPLDAECRKANVYWTHGTTEEIEEMKDFVRILKEKGQLVEWAREHDHVHETGFISLFLLSHKK